MFFIFSKRECEGGSLQRLPSGPLPKAEAPIDRDWIL
jgi:hypothetical protein